MENLEEAARLAAERWKGRTKAKDELREIAFALLKEHNMTQVAKMLDMSRTSLYYLLYGQHGKAFSAALAHEQNLRVHDAELETRKSA